MIKQAIRASKHIAKEASFLIKVPRQMVKLYFPVLLLQFVIFHVVSVLKSPPGSNEAANR